jgi:hypothetical protein
MLLLGLGDAIQFAIGFLEIAQNDPTLGCFQIEQVRILECVHWSKIIAFFSGKKQPKTAFRNDE